MGGAVLGETVLRPELSCQALLSRVEDIVHHAAICNIRFWRRQLFGHVVQAADQEHVRNSDREESRKLTDDCVAITCNVHQTRSIEDSYGDHELEQGYEELKVTEQQRSLVPVDQRLAAWMQVSRVLVQLLASLSLRPLPGRNRAWQPRAILAKTGKLYRELERTRMVVLTLRLRPVPTARRSILSSIKRCSRPFRLCCVRLHYHVHSILCPRGRYFVLAITKLKRHRV